MAKNTYKNTSKKKSGIKRKRIDFSFLKDRRFHLAIGFFLLATSVFILVSMISYLFTGKADQSVVESILETGIKASGQETDNWMRLLGAITSHYFVFRWFGLASFLIPPFLFLIGYRIVFHKALLPIGPTFKFVLFFLFWISMLFGYLLLNAEPSGSWSYLSGGVGYSMAELLHSLMGWGTFLFLGFLLLVFIVYFFNVTSLFGFRSKVKEGITELEENLKEDIEDLQTIDEDLGGEENTEDDETASWIVKNVDEAEKPQMEIEVEESSEEDVQELSIEPKEHVKPEELVSEETEETPELIIEEEQAEEKLADTVENYDPTLDLGTYRYPTLDLLEEHSGGKVQVTKEELELNKDKIIETLINFKIGISSIKATIGPTVTLYEIVPDAGIKISKIKNLEDDIALSLAALGIRIIAPIPGKGTIGIEVPNKNREMVSLKSVLQTDKFMRSTMELPIVLGKTISNEVFISDLAKMPHLLMAGATGQGKSVGINVILASLIYKKHPSQLKFVMVDPKKVELSLFNKIERHFLAKLPDDEDAIVTDTKKVVYTLNSLCIEMDNRYNLLKEAMARNLKEYNAKFVQRKLNPEKGHRFLPYIVLVVDELADLMMTAGKEIEMPIARLAQLARAIGIHLVVATQRPSVNVITGVIKANFPARLSFRVTSKIDSRTILDAGGADQLVGMGDMLLSMDSDIIRLQCPFIDTPEVQAICEYVGSQRGYESAYLLPEYVGDEGDSSSSDVDLADRDTMFEDAARLIVSHQQGSTSLIQRKLKLGYNRAGRIIDQLEAAGIVGSFEGSKAREVLVKDEYSLEQLLNSLNEKEEF